MQLTFQKMNGAGNDFIVIDNRDLNIELSREQIASLCDRHRGIGADGLLAVEPAEGDADFKFRYYNADGGEAEMCGNGARCFGRYTAQLDGKQLQLVSFETIAGVLSAEMVGDQVKIAMSDPFDLEKNLPCELPEVESLDFINTGVPHAVARVQDLQVVDVVRSGSTIRHDAHFQPKGTNANFYQALGKSHIAIRTYERGVENETLACGTGMCACALMHHLHTGDPAPVQVAVAGGDTLEIGFSSSGQDRFSDVTLCGPADFVFTGSIQL